MRPPWEWTEQDLQLIHAGWGKGKQVRRGGALAGRVGHWALSLCPSPSRRVGCPSRLESSFLKVPQCSEAVGPGGFSVSYR